MTKFISEQLNICIYRNMKAKMAIAFALSILVVASISSFELYSYENIRNHPGLVLKVTNMDSALGQAFSSGSIQAFGQNSSSILLSGTSTYYKPTDFSTPALVSLGSLNAKATGINLSEVANHYFHDGSVFGTSWNGSSWIITGEISWGRVDEGAAVVLNNTGDYNLTADLGKYFQNGGIWFDSWNGSGWLFGGNEDKHASLVGLYHGKFIDYSGLIGPAGYDSWIQLIMWNGTSWLIGGHFIFGFLTSGRYYNLISKTEFYNSGVYSAVYTQGKWIIGGGPKAALEVINGTSVSRSFNLPAYFDNWVNGLAPFEKGFVAGGEASAPNGHMEPALYYFSLTGSGIDFTNITDYLPSSFSMGQVQFLAPVSLSNVTGILIVGQGNYNETNGHSNGAMALLTD